MGFIFASLVVIQHLSISLGLGGSTIAIVNFFFALKDNHIDPTERRMMGLVYTILRIAEVLILLSTLGLFMLTYTSSVEKFSVLEYGQLCALLVLFINGLLMTIKRMPVTFGPSIQAGSWYTLGFISAVTPLGINVTAWQFFLGYITWIVFAVAFVNGMIAIMKTKKHGFLHYH
jgi:hypothetical protein